MSQPSEDSLILASIALIDLAESQYGPQSEAFRNVADYLLRLSSLLAFQRERATTEPADITRAGE